MPDAEPARTALPTVRHTSRKLRARVTPGYEKNDLGATRRVPFKIV
jgi:hypothetical protein